MGIIDIEDNEYTNELREAKLQAIVLGITAIANILVFLVSIIMFTDPSVIENNLSYKTQQRYIQLIDGSRSRRRAYDPLFIRRIVEDKMHNVSVLLTFMWLISSPMAALCITRLHAFNHPNRRLLKNKDQNNINAGVIGTSLLPISIGFIYISTLLVRVLDGFQFWLGLLCWGVLAAALIAIIIYFKRVF